MAVSDYVIRHIIFFTIY